MINDINLSKDDKDLILLTNTIYSILDALQYINQI